MPSNRPRPVSYWEQARSSSTVLPAKDEINSGFDHELIRQVRGAVYIPVVASSCAGSAQHFVAVFKETDVEAALAAGIFHRQKVPVSEVK